MQNFFLMAMGDASDELIGEALDNKRIHALFFAEIVHELLEVVLQILEHQHQLSVGVDHLAEGNDIGVAELFEDGDFADGGRGNAFFLGLESDFLEGVDLVCLLVCFKEEVPRAL